MQWNEIGPHLKRQLLTPVTGTCCKYCKERLIQRGRNKFIDSPFGKCHIQTDSTINSLISHLTKGDKARRSVGEPKTYDAGREIDNDVRQLRNIFEPTVPSQRSPKVHRERKKHNRFLSKEDEPLPLGGGTSISKCDSGQMNDAPTPVMSRDYQFEVAGQTYAVA